MFIFPVCDGKNSKLLVGVDVSILLQLIKFPLIFPGAPMFPVVVILPQEIEKEVYFLEKIVQRLLKADLGTF